MSHRNISDAMLPDVLAAAEALLAASENDMVTSEEWDALKHAVAAATQPSPDDGRDETFRVVEDVLIRSVVPAPGRGEPYEHSCEREVFEAAAHTINELNGASFTYEEVRQVVQTPFTQVAVAIAFLKERSIIVPTVRRRHVAAGESVHLDAMTEWHALREMPTG